MHIPWAKCIGLLERGQDTLQKWSRQQIRPFGLAHGTLQGSLLV